MNLEIRNITPIEWTIPERELKRIKEIGTSILPPYTRRYGLRFTIGRKPDDKYTGYDQLYFCNMVRRYINARTEVCILYFDMNHERTSTEPNVIEIGDTCLVDQIRIAMSGVLCKQIKSNEYELHAVNETPVIMDIMTSHIFRRGETDAKEWHGDFAPSIKIGTLMPGSELHISSIYMKTGRVFTDEIHHFENGQLIKPSDNCNYLHNGYVGFEQPEIVDYKNDKIIANPMLVAPTYVNFKIHLQPYIDPKSILIQSLDVLSKDLQIILTHVKNAANLNENTIDYRSDRVIINANEIGDITMTLLGFDESIGKTIVGVAKKLEKNITHYTSYREHINIKKVIVRISAPNPINLLLNCVAAIKDQVVNIASNVSL